ncbi:hypothetical protein os4_38480 (plasmid) [Comamonadaceae bacterium OS-4]|nr:hypothetical protein os4_38480 [Comamonadaceae bacterium OS-4]
MLRKQHLDLNIQFSDEGQFSHLRIYDHSRALEA